MRLAVCRPVRYIVSMHPTWRAPVTARAAGVGGWRRSWRQVILCGAQDDTDRQCGRGRAAKCSGGGSSLSWRCSAGERRRARREAEQAEVERGDGSGHGGHEGEGREDHDAVREEPRGADRRRLDTSVLGADAVRADRWWLVGIVAYAARGEDSSLALRMTWPRSGMTWPRLSMTQRRLGTTEPCESQNVDSAGPVRGGRGARRGGRRRWRRVWSTIRARLRRCRRSLLGWRGCR